MPSRSEGTFTLGGCGTVVVYSDGVNDNVLDSEQRSLVRGRCCFADIAQKALAGHRGVRPTSLSEARSGPAGAGPLSGQRGRSARRFGNGHN